MTLNEASYWFIYGVGLWTLGSWVVRTVLSWPRRWRKLREILEHVRELEEGIDRLRLERGVEPLFKGRRWSLNVFRQRVLKEYYKDELDGWWKREQAASQARERAWYAENPGKTREDYEIFCLVEDLSERNPWFDLVPKAGEGEAS